MTDEANIETISSDSSGNSIADNNSDFYSKLAALTGGDVQEEIIEDSGSDLSLDDEQEQQEEVVEQAIDDEEEDVPGAENIPKGLQKRWKKVIDLKNKVKSELEQEREQRIRYQTQYENYEKALQKYFEGQGNPEELTQSPDVARLSDEFDPLDETAHNVYMKEINDLRKELQEIKGKTVTKEEVQIQQASQAFKTAIDSQRREFEAKTPDYKEAVNYLRKVKMLEAEMVYGAGEAAETAALQDILTKSAGLYQQGKNVPESIYNMAKSYGYAGKAKQSGSNIDAISNNMKRGAGEPAGRASIPLGTSNYTQPGYLKKLKDADGAIDGRKFQQIIDNIRKGG